MRAVVLSVLAVVAIGYTAWLSDWFELAVDTPIENAEHITVSYGLRTVTICNAPSQGVCVTISDAALAKNPLMPETSDAWARERLLQPFHPAPLTASLGLWALTAFGAIVLLQLVLRLIGNGSSLLALAGYIAGLAALALVLAFAYALAPDAAFFGKLPPDFSIAVGRTFAPLLALAGIACGLAGLRYASASESYDSMTASPRLAPTRTDEVRVARVRRDVPDSIPLDGGAPVPAAARSQTPSTQPLDNATQELAAALRGKLAYAMHSADLGDGGIDARREDGTNVLVMWRDITGVIVRRAPSEYRHVAIVDIVSSPGSTLRLVPWTRCALAGDGDGRVRAFVVLVRERCPTVKLDAPSLDFVDRGKLAQLDLDALAAHDARLA